MRSSSETRGGFPCTRLFVFLSSPRCWEQLIWLSANRAIVDEVKEEKRLKRISRRGFIFGSAALSVVGRRGFALAESLGGRLLLVGAPTSGTRKGIHSYSFD